MGPVLFVARFPSPRLVNKISKNRQFASGAGPLKAVGLVAVTGLAGAVNFALQPGCWKAGEGKEFFVWKHQQAACRARIWALLMKCAPSIMAGWT
jgi:hypothetical protein